MKIETVYNINDCVSIVELERKGRIVSIFITATGMQYSVRYFWNGEANTVYFYEEEIEKI